MRNEEVNRRRLQGNRGTGGGPLKVTDPAAFARLMAEMKAKADEQKKVEEEREAERARREGASYKSPEERAKESKDSKAKFRQGEEARSIDDNKFDPSKDYYAILGVDRAASAAQIRQKYKRLALLYHPDKHKSETPEEQAAVEASFRQVAAAFDILVDEEQRALYDKCRDYMETNPGKGLPPLTPEESAMMASGAAELRKLRKMGPKLAKHPPTHREVEVSLPKLNSGCTRAVAVERRRVDYCGKEHLSTKTFHLVIRKGSREGDRITFSDDGDETVDTHPGDLIFTLRAKPHPVFRRKGEKDLEVFAAVPAGMAVYATEVDTINGKKRIVVVPALRAALQGGGVGGLYHAVIPALGLFDSKDPWDVPPGDLHIQLRYPAVLLHEKTVVSSIRSGPVYLLGCAEEPVPAALVAGSLAAGLRHRAEVQHMRADYKGKFPCTTVVCISIEMGGVGSNIVSEAMSLAAASEATRGSTSREFGITDCSSASHAMLGALRNHVPGLITSTATFRVPDGHLEDSAWSKLHHADAIILDLRLSQESNCLSTSGEDKSSERETEAEQRESALESARRSLEDSGILQTIWSRHWAGASIVASGDACGLLGREKKEEKRDEKFNFAVLPWYGVRAGSWAAGWQHACLGAVKTGVTTVGVLASSAYVVDTVTGEAELVIAPCKEALVARAEWDGPTGAAERAEEADEDFGYFAAFRAAT